MIEQAAKLSAPCQNCHRTCEGWAVQRAPHWRLQWELEWACDECGISHDGDWGLAPDTVRQPLLSQYGYWRVTHEGAAVSSGKTLKAFRDALGGTIQQARESAKAFNDSGFLGTFVEVSLVSHFLEVAGILNSTHPCRDERP